MPLALLIALCAATALLVAGVLDFVFRRSTPIGMEGGAEVPTPQLRSFFREHASIRAGLDEDPGALQGTEFGERGLDHISLYRY